MKRISIILVCLALLVPSASGAGQLSGVASVIDGDTIEIHGTRIRLYGIDSAESNQFCVRNNSRYRCGQAAAFALANKIGRRVVRCEHRDTDRYGRMVAVCHINQLDLNAWMVRTGHAIAYRKYSKMYVVDERQARTAQRGLWAGSFQTPADFRRQQRNKPSAPKRIVCRCPNDKDSAGRKCGKRSAYFRSGGSRPSCSL